MSFLLYSIMYSNVYNVYFLFLFNVFLFLFKLFHLVLVFLSWCC